MSAKLHSRSLTVDESSSHTADLHWLTASEINSCYYEIQRSTDAIDFTVIGRVAAAGYSIVPLDYSYIDQVPLSGVAYYRLREVDCDGADIYSQIVPYTTATTTDLSVYPNPANNALHLYLSQPDQGCHLVLTDLPGSELLSQPISQTETSIDISRLATGIYIWWLILADGNIKTGKVLKE